MTHKYETEGARFTPRAVIKVVEIERETDNCVWIRGRRNSKHSDYSVYHDTWEQAHAFLMKVAENKVVGIRRQLELANSALGNVKGMKKPPEAA